MQRVPFCRTCCKPYALQGSGKPVGYRIPKLLDCSHTFCQGCVSKFAGHQPRVLICPTCNEQTVLSGGKKNVRGLPTNLYILGILINNVKAVIEKDITKGELLGFEFQKSTSVGRESDSMGIPSEGACVSNTKKVCDECSKMVAISHCKKWEALYCENCFDSVHSSSRTLSSHEPIPIALLQLDEVTTQTCETHEGRELEFYDQDEAKLICSLCILTTSYQGHNILPANQITNEISEKVKKSLENVRKVHSQLQKSKERLMLFLPEMKTEFNETVQNIREHFQDLHTKLQARELNLIKEMRDAYCNKTLPAEVAEEISQQTGEVESLIKQVELALSAPSVMMKVGGTLLSKMSNFEDIPCVLPNSFLHDLVTISYAKEFEVNMSSYGAIIVEPSSLKMNKISEQPNDIDEKENQPPFDNATTTSDDQKKANTPSSGSPSSLLTLPPRQNLVTVCHISTPTDFFIQHVADIERLENLMDSIQTHCKGAKSMSDVVKTTEIGDLVCAKSLSDEWWYRARIVGKKQTSTTTVKNQSLPKVIAYFIDYGNTEEVPINWLCTIPPKYSNLPELATNCSLMDIVPPGCCQNWPNKSIKAFGSIVRDKHLLMAVVKKKYGKLLVDLKSPDTDCIAASDKPASVRDALVFLEVAHFNSPVSSPNPDVAFPVQTYPKVQLPKEGEELQVSVSYTQTPDEVYVQKYHGDEYDEMLKVLQQMMNLYNSKNGKQWQIGWPYKGMICAARYSADENWYRALITDVSADQMVKVVFVDFGNSEELSLTEVRRLPDHLSKLPRQAIKCCLAGIKPVGKDTKWTNACTTFLNDNCFLHPYQMKVVEAEDDEVISVVLNLPTPQQGLQVVSLNQQLVESSLAAFSTDAECYEMINTEPSSPASNSSTRVSDADDTSSIQSEQGKLLYPQQLSYKPVDMPKSDQFQFLVTYVDKDCTVSGFQPDKRDHSLVDLMRHMQNICKDKGSSSVTQDQLAFSQPCCAKYSTDNEWYRAQIVGFPTSTTVLVDYVDFGNREEIPLASISLNAAFLDIPKQCISVKLEGLPQTPVELEKISICLEGLLVGKICKAVASTLSTVGELISIEHLILPNGNDAVDAARVMMLRHYEACNEKPPAIQKQKNPLPMKTQQEQQLTEKIPPPARTILRDTVLPDLGIPFDVAITQINSKKVVFLQRELPSDDNPRLAVGHDPTDVIACNHLHQLLKMSNKINLKNYFNGRPNVSKVWNNMLCCAKYTEDDLWYRAQVLEVLNKEPLTARVLYVDYGTSEVIGVERMKPFPAELASLPKQAFQCNIVGMEDDNANDDTYCSDDSDNGFESLAKAVTNKKLICKIASTGPPILVELYDRVFNEVLFEDVPISQRVSEIDAISDESEGADDDQVSSSEEVSGEGETLSMKGPLVMKNDEVFKDCEREEFMGDVTPIADWYSECEKTFQDYDKVLACQQLLTPAQFMLKKERLVNDEKSTMQVEESEVD